MPLQRARLCTVYCAESSSRESPAPLPSVQHAAELLPANFWRVFDAFTTMPPWATAYVIHIKNFYCTVPLTICISHIINSLCGWMNTQIDLDLYLNLSHRKFFYS